MMKKSMTEVSRMAQPHAACERPSSPENARRFPAAKLTAAPRTEITVRIIAGIAIARLTSDAIRPAARVSAVLFRPTRMIETINARTMSWTARFRTGRFHGPSAPRRFPFDPFLAGFGPVRPGSTPPSSSSEADDPPRDGAGAAGRGSSSSP